MAHSGMGILALERAHAGDSLLEFKSDESARPDAYQIGPSRTMALLSLCRNLCCQRRLLLPHGSGVVCSHSGPLIR